MNQKINVSLYRGDLAVIQRNYPASTLDHSIARAVASWLGHNIKSIGERPALPPGRPKGTHGEKPGKGRRSDATMWPQVHLTPITASLLHFMQSVVEAHAQARRGGKRLFSLAMCVRMAARRKIRNPHTWTAGAAPEWGWQLWNTQNSVKRQPRAEILALSENP